MAAPSFRDRLLQPACGAGPAVAGRPRGRASPSALWSWSPGCPWWAGWRPARRCGPLNVVRLLPRGPGAARIDPFTVQEPWRRFVQDALQARTRVRGRRRPGAGRPAARPPARDRRPRRRPASTSAGRSPSAARPWWRPGVASTSPSSTAAPRPWTPGRRRPGATACGPRPRGPGHRGRSGPPPSRHRRGDRSHPRPSCTVLDARLDEAVARTLELTARASTDGAGLAGLDSDVDVARHRDGGAAPGARRDGAAAGARPADPGLPPGRPAGGDG